jgi:outer membrane protein OmpA-like peptidoglycan-associated protein
MKQLFSKIFLLVLLVSSITVRSQVTTSVAKPVIYPAGKFYIGLKGGYLFQNNSVYNNPMWHIQNGYFGEVNGGWRKNSFGWSIAGGYLTLMRDPSKFENVSLNQQMIYDSIVMYPMNIKPAIVKGLDDKGLQFGPSSHDSLISRDFKGYYAMTGPDFWFGTKRLQLHTYVQAGVGYSKFGYYAVTGKGGTFDNTAPHLETASANQYGLIVDGQYHQFGMTQQQYNAITSSGSLLAPEKSVFHFMARTGADAEYFIAPKISVHAGAGYWYIGTPQMKGEQFSKSNSTAFIPIGPGTVGVGAYQYTDTYSKKTLGFVNANAGVKVWLGKTKEKIVKAKPETITAPIVAVPKAESKDLLIVVKDEATGLALSGVKVDVLLNGSLFTTAITNENGQIEKISAIAPGNYSIKGDKNNIATTVETITEADFANSAKLIYKELKHNDPRFTLIGYTIEKKSETRKQGVGTTLTNDADLSTQNQTSDAGGKFIYQLNPQSSYTVVASSKGVFSNIEAVSTKGLDRSKTLYVNLVLGVDELSTGNSFELKNILYDINSAVIRTDAAKVLDNLADVMKNNPTLVIELSSHTDSRASNAYNQKLSQKRAEAAVQYLVSKGIDKKRLVAKGYGESKLLNSCADGVSCSEADHQANRRTEIKVLNN